MNVSLQQEPIRGFWKRVALFLLKRLTNPHSKRILFLTSLYCRISHLDQMRDDVIDHLNGLLDLAKRREALKLPATVQALVWNIDSMDTVIQQQLTDAEFNEHKTRSLSEQLVDSAPVEFQYGDRLTMVDDVYTMLKDIFERPQQVAMA